MSKCQDDDDILNIAAKIYMYVNYELSKYEPQKDQNQLGN